MNKNLDLTEILKDCPQGMELDCTMFEDVYFDYVDELNIIHCYVQHKTHRISLTFNQHGTYSSDIKSKCVIFPKGKTTWEGFQRPFEDGDILSYQNKFYNNRTIYIYKYHRKMNTSYYVALSGSSDSDFMINNKYGCALDNYNDTARFATEEEKQKLFDAIKANGYRWNSETKTLEELIVPKFKVGDTIQSKTDNNDKFTITTIDDNKFYYGCGNGHEFMIPIKKQDNWILIPNKFDPKFFKPFDKVLCRMNNNDIWGISLFERYAPTNPYPFFCIQDCFSQCVPYNDKTKHLIGTNNEAPEYYKCWED